MSARGTTGTVLLEAREPGRQLTASVLSGHASDQFPDERGYADGCPVRRRGRVRVRRVSHEHRRSIVGRVSQRPTGLPAAYSLRTHMNSVCTWGWRCSQSSHLQRGHISYRDQGDGGWYRMRSVRKLVVVAMVAITVIVAAFAAGGGASV